MLAPASAKLAFLAGSLTLSNGAGRPPVVALGADLDAGRLGKVLRDPSRLALPQAATLGDVLVAQARIVEAMSDGRISPEEASLMSTVLDAQRKAIETTELAEEIERIKERLEMDGG
jgi:hypothetical protein